VSADPVPVWRRLFDVTGRGVLVTGAASGLGFAIADVLASCGARVTLADVDWPGVHRATVTLAEAGGAVRGAVVDVADAGAVDELCAGVAGTPGGLDVVFANAGISAGPGPRTDEGRLAAVDQERWDHVVAVNLRGAFATVAAAGRHITPGGRGRVVVTASVAGLRGDPMVGYAYAMTKAGVIALVRQAAPDLARDGTLVNAIAPGAFRTGIGGGRTRDPEVERAFAQRAALGRLADPAELQGLALYLASPSSSYVTGAVFTIDGGT
jgi:NAD(P)-dependent dehydrogenase (short-subunit alcohol dehydrogenase family)